MLGDGFFLLALLFALCMICHGENFLSTQPATVGTWNLRLDRMMGKNLFDKEYFTGGIPLGASLGVNNASVGEPRTYGVELTAKF